MEKISSIECFGRIQKFNWLAVKKGRICLVADWKSGNTEWILHQAGKETVCFECKDIKEPNRWLFADTMKRKVFLTDKDAALGGSGGKWQVLYLDSDRFRLKCQDNAGAYCYLDGITKRGFLSLQREDEIEDKSGTFWKLTTRELSAANSKPPPAKERKKAWKQIIFLPLLIFLILIVAIVFANGQSIRSFSMKLLGMDLSAEFNDKAEIKEKVKPYSVNVDIVKSVDKTPNNESPPEMYYGSLSELKKEFDGEKVTVAVKKGTTAKLFDDNLLLTITEISKAKITGFIFPLKGEKKIFQKIASGEAFSDHDYEIRVLEVLEGETKLLVKEFGKYEKR